MQSVKQAIDLLSSFTDNQSSKFSHGLGLAPITKTSTSECEKTFLNLNDLFAQIIRTNYSKREINHAAGHFFKTVLARSYQQRIN